MDTLTILYTNQIQGDFSLLPRLYTFLQRLKQQYDVRALLLDLGDSCTPAVWHCAATAGRSTLIVLDCMGYHAANVSGFMGDSDRDRLRSSVSIGIVTERHGWRYFVPPVRDEDIIVAGKPTPALKLCIIAAPADDNHLENRMLHLKQVAKGQVGMVKVDMQTLAITASDILTMPKGLNPNPTIAASIDLVEDEARRAQNR